MIFPIRRGVLERSLLIALFLFLTAGFTLWSADEKVVGEISRNTKEPAGEAGSSLSLGQQSEAGSYYQDPTEMKRSEESFTMVWVKLILIMAVFVGACLALMVLLKKKNQVESVGNELFEVVSDFNLAINKKIKIIRVVNDYFVLSVSQDHIGLISHITDKESLDKLKLEEGRTGGRKYFFSDLLQSYVGGQKWQSSTVTDNLKRRLGKVE